MEPKSPRRQSPRRQSPRISPRQKEGVPADDVVQRLLQLLKQKPPFEKFAFSVDEIARKQTQGFQQCFASKSRVGKLIQSSPNEELILVMLQYSTADPQSLRQIVEQKIPITYLLLNQEYMKMVSTTSAAQRDQQALLNIYKIELIFQTMIKRYNFPVPTNILVRWMALMPGDLREQSHINFLNEIVRRIGTQGNLELNFIFDLVSLELSGSGSLAILLARGPWTSQMLADSIIQFAAFKKVELSKLFRVLFKNYKTLKCHEVVEEVIKRLNVQMNVGQLMDIFVNFIKTVLFAQMAKDIVFQGCQKIVRAILSNDKLQLTGTLNYEEFNWLVTNNNKNYFQQHLLLLKALAKRCLPPNLIETFTKYLDDYLQSNQNLSRTADKMNVPSSAKDLTATNQRNLENTLKPTTAMPSKGSKDLFISDQTLVQQPPQKLQLQYSQQMPICHDYIGLPNIGNSCYISSFIVALTFCKQATQALFKSKPKDRSIQYLRNLVILLFNRQKNQLKANVTEFKKTLPEELSTPNMQMDTMELGRCLVDKLSSVDEYFKTMFEIKIEESIVCPRFDIIEKRVVQDSFMILSFQDPKLFSKIQSKIGQIQLNSMIIRDYFTPSIIQGDFQCEVCKQKFNKRQKRQRILAMPNVLIVVLARFTYDIQRNIKRKVCDRVKIDNWLMFGNITSSTKPDNYKLISFINHMGKNAQSGHYQAHARHPKRDDRWLNFDDDFVTESVYQKVAELVRNFNQFDTPYVLFYEKA